VLCWARKSTAAPLLATHCWVPSFPEVGQSSMWISTDAAASALEPLKVVWAKCSGYPSYPALVSWALGVESALLGSGTPSHVLQGVVLPVLPEVYVVARHVCT
jgi:hypothetical protein